MSLDTVAALLIMALGLSIISLVVQFFLYLVSMRGRLDALERRIVQVGSPHHWKLMNEYCGSNQGTRPTEGDTRSGAAE